MELFSCSKNHFHMEKIFYVTREFLRTLMKFRIVQIIKPKENPQRNLIWIKSNSPLKSLTLNTKSSFGPL